MTELGGFAGLCSIPTRYKQPLLVSCTDGVGTKLKLAFLTGRHDTVGIDLVAMSVNDMAVSGAEPLFFLDYFAAGKLDVGVAEQVIAGIADGCQAAGCALVGGETAELPGFYAEGEYDLAGVFGGRRREEPPGRRARDPPRRSIAGARVVRVSFERILVGAARVPRSHAAAADATPPGLSEPLASALLRPTRIYVRALRALHDADLLRGAAHITGGGLVENPTRMLPADARLRLRINLGAWTGAADLRAARARRRRRGRRDAANVQHGHRHGGVRPR
jgi:phosphoribosylformylglycinamidine cyclo-ligase